MEQWLSDITDAASALAGAGVLLETACKRRPPGLPRDEVKALRWARALGAQLLIEAADLANVLLRLQSLPEKEPRFMLAELISAREAVPIMVANLVRKVRAKGIRAAGGVGMVRSVDFGVEAMEMCEALTLHDKRRRPDKE